MSAAIVQAETVIPELGDWLQASPLLSLIRICRGACSGAAAGDARSFVEIVYMLENSGVAKQLYDLADGLDIMDKIMKREYNGPGGKAISAGGSQNVKNEVVSAEPAIDGQDGSHEDHTGGEAAKYYQQLSAEDADGYYQPAHEHHEPHSHHSHHGHGHDGHHAQHGHGHHHNHGHHGRHEQHAHHGHHGNDDIHAHQEHHGHHHHRKDHGYHAEHIHGHHDDQYAERAFEDQSPVQQHHYQPGHAQAVKSDAPHAAESGHPQGGLHGAADHADVGTSEAEHARQRAEYREEIEAFQKFERDHDPYKAYDQWMEDSFPDEHK